MAHEADLFWNIVEGDTDSVVEFAASMPDVAISVGQLTAQIAQVIAADPILSDVPVRGEISNWKTHSSGHCYFTLKDEDGDANIRAVLWRKNAANLQFRPNNGDRVIANGRVEFYDKRGEINLVVDDLRFDGQGALHEAFERLRIRLESEGLFDAALKRPLPALPRRIGIVTSLTGAVAHDITNVLTRRWPLATLVFIGAKMQGFDAPPDIVRALSWAAAAGDLDVMIVARGGGSAEDLWCFNDEELVRAAREFPVPLVSAIGHETDFTLLDFAADLRAPTPSAAAELVAPHIGELMALLRGQRRRLHGAVEGDVRLARGRLDWLKARPALRHPSEQLKQRRIEVARLGARGRDALERRVKIERQLLAARRAQLHALDPQRVLERGYALLSDENGVVSDLGQIARGKELNIALHDGRFTARVEDLED